MSRSLLLIIADFLLLSLLALARFDHPDQEAASEEARRVQEEAGAERDLVEVLELSLRNEQQNREDLAHRLEVTESELATRDEALRLRERELEETSKDLEDERVEIERLDEERESLESVKWQLEREKSKLSAEYADVQSFLAASEQERGNLLDGLTAAHQEAAVSKERVRILQGQLGEREREIVRAKDELTELEEREKAAQSKNRQLATELQIRETEKLMLEQNLIAAQAEIETVRVEKESIQRETSRLAEGVTVLAESSAAIHNEIRQIQPLSANTIFQDFRENRASIRITAELANGRKRHSEVESVLVSDGTRTYALFLARETPFRLDGAKNRFNAVTASVNLGGMDYRLEEMVFLVADPRLMATPVQQSAIDDSGAGIFPLALEPFRFPEAVLIGADEEYYGESTFKFEGDSEQYLKMQARLFNRLFGEFSPKRGDLVFSKSGDFLGLMVDGQSCVLVDSLLPASQFPVGEAFSADRAEAAFGISRRVLAGRLEGYQ